MFPFKKGFKKLVLWGARAPHAPRLATPLWNIPLFRLRLSEWSFVFWGLNYKKNTFWFIGFTDSLVNYTSVPYHLCCQLNHHSWGIIQQRRKTVAVRMKFSKTKLSPFFYHGSRNLFRSSIIINTYFQLYSTQIKHSWHFSISQQSQFRKPSFWQPYWIDGVIEPGPKTKAVRILIIFGSGRCWSKEYQKNPRKFKICIIMHKICILCIFLKMHKNHFSWHFRWF